MIALVIVTWLTSIVLCGLHLLAARQTRLVAEPNARSSHVRPTPSGGGLPMLLALGVGLWVTGVQGMGWSREWLVLFGGGAVLVALGLADDARGLSVRLRLGLYGAIAFATLWVLADGITHGAVGVGWWLVLGSLVMLWGMNLYNFMDGIDGLAALQAVLACLAAAWLARDAGAGPAYAGFCLLLATVHLGFLVWNWPPARLFMGDAGSIPTGYWLAALALLGTAQGQLNPLCWLVLLAVFVSDASCTLVWRVITGQPFMQPHRDHAYQRLSRLWGSHRAVDVVLLGLHVFWLFPLAWAIQQWPAYGLFLVILAYLPLLLGMAKVRGLA
ncbi:MAG: glycosyl transferase [Pseudomonadota bacterium]